MNSKKNFSYAGVSLLPSGTIKLIVGAAPPCPPPPCPPWPPEYPPPPDPPSTWMIYKCSKQRKQSFANIELI